MTDVPETIVERLAALEEENRTLRAMLAAHADTLASHGASLLEQRIWLQALRALNQENPRRARELGELVTRGLQRVLGPSAAAAIAAAGAACAVPSEAAADATAA